MFFFIAGITPKTKTINDKPERCPVCGLHQAYQKRIDHYLSVFFIPVMRVKKGEPFIICESCHRYKADSSRDETLDQEATSRLCKFCRSPIYKGYVYCPHCGKKL